MSSNSNPSGFQIIVDFSITFGLIFLGKLSHSNPIPVEINKIMNDKYVDSIYEKKTLEQFIRYSLNDELISNTSFSQFTASNSDELKRLYVENEEICNSLNLESSECYEDCIYYLSPLTLLLDNSDDSNSKIQKIFNWYQMGGGPMGWYETGNIDMCQYMDGTYCYTPIQMVQGSFLMNLQEHGCCLPGTCTGDDAVKVLQENTWCYGGYQQTYTPFLYFGNITNVCQPLERDVGSPGFCIVSAIFIIFLLFVCIASIRTQYLMELQAKDQELSASLNEKQNVYDNNWFLYSFSIQNLWKLFTRKRPVDKSQFNFLDGIRVVSMSWVIWGHVYLFFFMSSPSNQFVFIPFSASAKQYPYVFTQFYMMIAEYGFFSVDSFFYLAGFLSAFSLHRHLARYGKKAIQMCYIWIPLSYIKRILRLWPMMAFILFVQWYIADQLSYGYRVISRDINNELCKNEWYKILFFYANLEKSLSDLGCMGHLWYIQCDMQMFLILPWILLLFKWNKLIGLLLSLLLFLTGIAIRTYFAIQYHFGANVLYPANETINDGDQEQEYFKPWTRMSPYFIGVFTILLIITLQEKQKEFQIKSRYVFIACMCLTGFIYICLVFWPYEDVKDAPTERWSLISNQIYYALSRPAWGAALGIMSFALTFKTKTLKSIIGTVLSVEIYQPLGKLTYTMYLIHWMVLSWFFEDLSTSTYYQFWWILCIFFAIWMITMCLTVILWFIMEQPMANLIGLGMKSLMNSLNGNKKSIDTELTNIVKKTLILKQYKQNNSNGDNIIDKLLIDSNNEQNNSLSASLAHATYGIVGSYESFVDCHQNGEEYNESIKRN